MISAKLWKFLEEYNETHISEHMLMNKSSIMNNMGPFFEEGRSPETSSSSRISSGYVNIPHTA